MKKLLLLATFAASFFLPAITCLAQTTVAQLEQGVEQYNAMRTYIAGLTIKNITDENITDVKMRMTKGVALLDKVIREGNSDQIKAARYFKLNYKYQLGFVYGMKGYNNQALDVFKEIEKEFTSFSSSDFPLRYVFFEKNYIIDWEDFAPTQAEFYTVLGELAYNLGKYEDAARVTRLAIAHPNLNDWLRYISYNKMLDVANKDPQQLGEAELQEYALKSIQAYDKLTDDYLKTVEEYKYPKVLRGVRTLLISVERNRTPLALERCAAAAPIAAKHEPQSDEVLQLYELCYRNRQTGDAAYHTAAEAYARKMAAVNNQRATYVGLAATDNIAKTANLYDCEALASLAEKYRFWKKTDVAAQYDAKAKICLDDRAKAAKKAEKAARRSNSDFNFYVGAHILPLLNTNPKRDYGAAVNFAFKRTALEFSYTLINQNKENIFDLWIREVDDAEQDNISRWDGFKAHFQPKFLAREGNFNSYIGILMGYNEKNFEEMTVNATHDLDGAVSSETFKPAVKQYVLMLNFGAMRLARGFGADLFWGMGANYSLFDDGSEINRDEYTIDNPLLENRKDKYFGFVMRLGITMGLNFGRGWNN